MPSVTYTCDMDPQCVRIDDPEYIRYDAMPNCEDVDGGYCFKTPAPSAMPSLSAVPSIAPTSTPSVMPSLSSVPSMTPSSEPSLLPSNNPSASASPSSEPSLSLMPSPAPRTGCFSDGIIITTSNDDGASSAVAADLDSDGDLDVLYAASSSDTIAWYANDGEGNFVLGQQVTTSANGARHVSVGDIDGDGDLDFLAVLIDGDEVHFYKNDGSGNFALEQVIATATDVDGPAFIQAADMDGDGDLDALYASYYDNKLAWHENQDGIGGFGSQQIIDTNNGPNSAFAADLDGDGLLDVLSTNRHQSTQNGDVSLYLNNPTAAGLFGGEEVLASPNGGRVVVAVDMDGDGDLDVLWGSATPATTVAWQANDGNGNFGPEQTISSDVAYVTSVFAADIDGDGDLDVVVTELIGNKLSWFENLDGVAGSFGDKQVIDESISRPYSIAAADLDGDGDMDILATAFSGDYVAWYRNDFC